MEFRYRFKIFVLFFFFLYILFLSLKSCFCFDFISQVKRRDHFLFWRTLAEKRRIVICSTFSSLFSAMKRSHQFCYDSSTKWAMILFFYIVRLSSRASWPCVLRLPLRPWSFIGHWYSRLRLRLNIRSSIAIFY